MHRNQQTYSMYEEIRRVEHIREYDEMVGAETLHPLVNVVDFSRLPPMRNIGFKRLFDYYAVYLKGNRDAELHYGRGAYDYREGAMVFIAPGQVAGVEDDGMVRQLTTHVLMFYPDLLHGTYLQPLAVIPIFPITRTKPCFPQKMKSVSSRSVSDALRRNCAISMSVACR